MHNIMIAPVLQLHASILTRLLRNLLQLKSTAMGVTARTLDPKATDLEQEQGLLRAQSKSVSQGEHQSFMVHGGMVS